MMSALRGISQTWLHKIQSQIKRWKANTLAHQRLHWAQELSNYDWESKEIFGNEWGDPNNPKDRLGNYLELKNQLVGLVTSATIVLEIGSLAGKWTQYLLHAKRIICVDINEVGFDYIRKKLPCQNIEFYLTKGNELKGIPSESVDLVFSLDTLVRVERSYINAYIKESHRVLKGNGCLFLHLPCNLKEDSVRRGFTDLSKADIIQMCNKAGFVEVQVDLNILKHGVLLKTFKS